MKVVVVEMKPCATPLVNTYYVYGMVWYGNNLFDITEIHNTLL